jgi:hypothetical protein
MVSSKCGLGGRGNMWYEYEADPIGSSRSHQGIEALF